MGIKGLLQSALQLAELPLCKYSLSVDGASCQTMAALAHAPWAMKGAMAAISDTIPMWGYHKASYVIAGAGIGSVCLASLALFPAPRVEIAALLLGGAHAQIASADLLCEGKYSELMRKAPRSGASVVSYVWGNVKVGQLLGAVLVGPVAESHAPHIRWLFLLLAPLAASIAVPTSLGLAPPPTPSVPTCSCRAYRERERARGRKRERKRQKHTHAHTRARTHTNTHTH